MNGGYSEISTGTTHKSRSIDFSDFYSFPPQTSKPDHNQVNKSKIQHPVVEGEGNGERFGVILGRSGSVSYSSGFQRAILSMRRSSSVSERYCRIHDQYMAIASPLANIADDDEWTRRRGSMKKKKKKLSSGGKIFKACKRLLGL